MRFKPDYTETWDLLNNNFINVILNCFYGTHFTPMVLNLFRLYSAAFYLNSY